MTTDTDTAPARLRIDPEDLTLDELELVETELGTSIDAAFADDSPKGRALKVLVWILRRRDEPELTLDDVGKLKLSELDIVTAEDATAGN